MSTRVLVVDDEEDLCEILQFNLEGEGYEVDVAYSAEEALKKDLKSYQVILLDVMMGKISGFKFAKMIRQEMKLPVPILFLTAKDGENNTLTGFSLGADDYISKPFSVREVIARVKAVIQRTRSEGISGGQKITYREFELDDASKQLVINKKTIELTKKEFEILYLLMDNPSRVFSREDMMNRIWTDEVVVMPRTVDVHVARLRKKLRKYGHYIRSRPGYGYYLEKE